MDIKTAQNELGQAYFRGGPGTIVSAAVWSIAGIAATRTNLPTGFGILFIAGMFIFPLTTWIVRYVLRCPPASAENPGGLTVMETVFPMMSGFLAGWLLIPYRPDLSIPMAAIAVGTHYFGFRTAYGDWTFWVLGALMCLVGGAAIFAGFPDANSVAFVISGIEFLFGCWFTWQGVRDRRN